MIVKDCRLLSVFVYQILSLGLARRVCHGFDLSMGLGLQQRDSVHIGMAHRTNGVLVAAMEVRVVPNCAIAFHTLSSRDLATSLDLLETVSDPGGRKPLLLEAADDLTEVVKLLCWLPDLQGLVVLEVGFVEVGEVGEVKFRLVDVEVNLVVND